MWFLTLLNDEKEQRRFDKTLEVQKMEDKVKTESHIFQCCSVEHAVEYANKADPWVVYSTILSTNMYGVPVMLQALFCILGVQQWAKEMEIPSLWLISVMCVCVCTQLIGNTDCLWTTLHVAQTDLTIKTL